MSGESPDGAGNGCLSLSDACESRGDWSQGSGGCACDNRCSAVGAGLLWSSLGAGLWHSDGSGSGDSGGRDGRAANSLGERARGALSLD